MTSEATFSYSGFGREFKVTLNGDDAEYLPKLLITFADFLRSSGFTYVGVKEMADGYLFHKHYDMDDDESWGETYNSEFFNMSDEEVQAEINQAASDYWDEQVEQALRPSDKAVAGEEVEAGDTVFYHGRGAGETTLNDHEQPQGHGGRTGISLINMKGKVVMVTSSPVGPRVLVKWNNWYDGHNGMGDDPNAVMSAKNYWWSNVNNVSKSN